MSTDERAGGNPLRLVLILAGIGVFWCGLYLWWRSTAQHAAKVSQQKYELKMFGLAYHGYHSTHDAGPPDMVTMRTTDRPGFWSRGHDPSRPTVVDEWVASGRLEVAWNGSFEATRAAGDKIGERFIAREVLADGAEVGWVVLGDGAFETLPRAELEALEPLVPKVDR